MVLSGLLALHELFESAQRTERVDDDLSGVGVGTQEQLSLGDISGIVRDGVSDVSVFEGRDRYDGDGTSVR